MKKISFVLGLLLSITICFLIVSLFLFNRRFIRKVIVKEKVVDVIYSEIDNDIEEDFYLDKDLLEIDLLRYIDNGYFLNIKNKIIINNENTRGEIYSKHVKLFNKYNLYKNKSTIYIITFVLCIITGLLFIKTSKVHNIDYVLLFSGSFSIIIYGIIYLFNNFSNSEVIIVNTLLHILLFVGVLFLVASIVLLNENRIKRILNCK